MAVTFVGLAGAVAAGVISFEGLDGSPVPLTLVAVTVKV